MGLVVVAAHHSGAFNEDFAVGSYLDFDAGKNGSDSADFISYIWEAADCGCGFRQSVADYDGYSHSPEEFGDCRTERSPGCWEYVAVFDSHYTLHFGEYAFVVELITGFKHCRHRFAKTHVVDVAFTACFQGTGAHPPAQWWHVADFFLDGRVGFLPEPWHGTHAGGVYFGDCVLDFARVAVYIDFHAAVKREECPCFLEDVAQRQEAERSVGIRERCQPLMVNFYCRVEA